MLRAALLLSVALTTFASRVVAQSPRAANPERPTVATHAYAVAPGHIEVEQGVSARGTSGLGDVTSWDVNVKIGIAPHIQLGLYGPGFARNGAGHGIGDWGAALKLRTDLSKRVAVAVVPGVTLPTGNERLGLGAGRALGQLPFVLSVNGPAGVHVDLNAGPLGIGAGRTQWLTTASFGRPLGGPLGLTAELYRISAGSSGPRQAGLLGALLVTPVEWMVIDVGGTLGLGSGSPDVLFLGVTTNFGKLF